LNAVAAVTFPNALARFAFVSIVFSCPSGAFGLKLGHLQDGPYCQGEKIISP
jgi:hypothetical protein